MDIEVGDFVRTNDGYLGKLIAINKQDYNYLVIDTSKNIRNDEYPATYLYLKNENIEKHSKNITDLIETGDILKYRFRGLNGESITIVKEYHDVRSNETWLLINGYKLENVDILEILTHEQYERNCYRLEE